MVKRSNNQPVKKSITDWLKVLVLLLDEAVVVVLVIVILRWLKIEIPIPVAIVLALALGVVVFIVHKAVIPSFHWRPASGSEALIGATGKVVGALKPVGTVLVRGERWKARSTAGNIETDEEVEIVGLDRLTLEVKRREQ